MRVDINKTIVPRIPPKLRFSAFGALLCSAHPLLQLLAHVLEHVWATLSLADVVRLASSCKHLRVFMRDADGIYYTLQYVRPLNAHNTRHRFFLPQGVPLLKTGRAQYSQPHAFALALRKHNGMARIRRVASRYKACRQRRAIREQRNHERGSMLWQALVALNLPAGLAVTSIEGIHYALNCRVCPDGLLEALLSNCVEAICFRWFLMHHTDYITRLNEHIAAVGFYAEAGAIIAAEYERPTVWPWLQHVF
jgi:hypothetical protein